MLAQHLLHRWESTALPGDRADRHNGDCSAVRASRGDRAQVVGQGRVGADEAQAFAQTRNVKHINLCNKNLQANN